ncbi:hypothetical protein HY972_02520 [Candidatus Kaiserbacteria bacterium]|nr:hypothetical protein [Candidatus Kaiserbacteria bacterium]
MSRISTLILLGILTILTPFSGLPIAIRTFLAVIFGAGVVGIGVALRASEARRAQPPSETSVSEPTPPQGVSPI